MADGADEPAKAVLGEVGLGRGLEGLARHGDCCNLSFAEAEARRQVECVARVGMPAARYHGSEREESDGASS
jgi:hypothetical protein